MFIYLHVNGQSDLVFLGIGVDQNDDDQNDALDDPLPVGVDAEQNHDVRNGLQEQRADDDAEHTAAAAGYRPA